MWSSKTFLYVSHLVCLIPIQNFVADLNLRHWNQSHCYHENLSLAFLSVVWPVFVDCNWSSSRTDSPISRLILLQSMLIQYHDLWNIQTFLAQKTKGESKRLITRWNEAVSPKLLLLMSVPLKDSNLYLCLGISW